MWVDWYGNENGLGFWMWVDWGFGYGWIGVLDEGGLGFGCGWIGVLDVGGLGLGCGWIGMGMWMGVWGQLLFQFKFLICEVTKDILLVFFS